MAYIPTNGQDGYGPRVGQSPEGHPIYLYTDPHSKLLSYVVVLPHGRAFYSDARGKIRGPAQSVVDAQISGAILTGTLGALVGGPVGAMVGAVAGALAAKLLKRQTA